MIVELFYNSNEIVTIFYLIKYKVQLDFLKLTCGFGHLHLEGCVRTNSSILLLSSNSKTHPRLHMTANRNILSRWASASVPATIQLVTVRAKLLWVRFWYIRFVIKFSFQKLSVRKFAAQRNSWRLTENKRAKRLKKIY